MPVPPQSSADEETVRARRFRLGGERSAKGLTAERLAQLEQALLAALASDHSLSNAALLAEVTALDLPATLHPAQLRARSKEFRLRAAAVSALVCTLIANMKAPSPALVDARRVTGQSALMLSGGGKLGHYHVGVIRALAQADLLPRTISGSSAGALIAALVGTTASTESLAHSDGRMLELSSDGSSGAREYYARPFDQLRLKTLIANLIPDWTFADAHAHSGRDMALVVAEARSSGSGRILTAHLTPNVLVRDAVLASCAVPFAYPPVVIRERTTNGSLVAFANGRKWMDGSVHADLPSAFLRRELGIDRLIASIVNPLELPILSDPDIVGQPIHDLTSMLVKGWRDASAAGLGFAAAMMAPVPGASRLFNISRRIIDQQIDADVIIAPGQRVHNWSQLAEDMSARQLQAFIDDGEKAAKAKLEILRPALSIERALARASAA